MATKKYDLAIKTGEYESQGQKKGRYQNIGSVMQGDNGPYIMLNALFVSSQLNGIANRERRDSLLVSMFEPKGEGGQRTGAKAPAPASGETPPLDDDIPF